MSRLPRRAPALALAAAVALLGTACGDDDATVAETGQPPTTTEADGTTTPTTEAVEVPAAPVAAALAEHVQLIAQREGARLGGRAAQVAAVDQALALNADAVVAALGGADPATVGAAWRDHLARYGQYSAATAAGDVASTDAARVALDTFASDAAALVGGGDDLAQALGTHVDGMLAAVDAMAAGDLAAAQELIAEGAERAERLTEVVVATRQQAAGGAGGGAGSAAGSGSGSGAGGGSASGSGSGSTGGASAGTGTGDADETGDAASGDVGSGGGSGTGAGGAGSGAGGTGSGGSGQADESGTAEGVADAPGDGGGDDGGEDTAGGGTGGSSGGGNPGGGATGSGPTTGSGGGGGSTPTGDDDGGSTPGIGGGSSDVEIDLVSEHVEHVLLAGGAIEAFLGGRTGEAEAALAALDRNTESIVGIVSPIDAEQAETFEALWTEHLDAYQAYAAGTRDGNPAGVEAARAGLTEYVDGVADLVEAWTDGEYPREEAAADYTAHVDGTERTIDALLAGDLATAYASGHEGAVHFAHVAERLAPSLQAAGASSAAGAEGGTGGG